MHNDSFAEIRKYTLGDTIREHRRSRPGMCASVDGAQRLTYQELDRRANMLADAFRKRDISKGDRVLWFGQNSAKIMELLLACAKIGSVLCPANWRLSPSEFLNVVTSFDPKIVFWQDFEIGHSYHANEEAWRARRRIWIQNDGQGTDSYDTLLASGQDVDIEEDVDPESPLLAVFTAAFSGRPLAAQLSHTSILLQSMISGRGQSIDESSRYLMSGPMFHIGVLMGGFATFVAGGRCIYIRKIEPTELLNVIEQERVTHAFLPGPVVEALLNADTENKRDLTSLFPTREISDWVPPLAIPQNAPMRHNMGVYGQTELMGSIVLRWLGGNGAGRPAPFVQIRLLDEEGREVAIGKTGEIAAKGPLVMCGYYGAPNENSARTSDGWYRTRDIGRRNPDGSITFVGPKTTMIKSGLENIYPAEIEACVRRHPAVKDVCVIGVPDPKWAQNVKAIVVLQETVTASAAEIIEHCKLHLASYKKPKIIEFCASLPRLPSGAIDRAAVDAAWGGGGYPQSG